jgi:uncharacterized protein YndB with AHSA1/START domain
MITAHVVKKQIAINAPPSAVWDALTNPEKTKKYFFNCEVFSDWKTGSAIVFKGKMFLLKKIELKGEIIKIEKEKFLQYWLHNEDSTSVSTVTDELSFEEGKTILTITDDVGEGEGAEERYERSEKGWDKVLNGLKELVEENL